VAGGDDGLESGLSEYSTALAITCERPPPPSDMLITWAPWSAAQRIASLIAAEVPEPKWSSTLTGIRVASKATPATPSRLLVTWAMVPATWVPWP
jgi:hypothetical protein